jgi:hypothetical protein
MTETSNSSRPSYSRRNAVDLDFAALLHMEVLGLESSDDGRNCTMHLCCGHYIRKNDKLVCESTLQVINSNTPEPVVKVFSLNNDGLPQCHVGYIPKHYFRKFGTDRFHLMYLRVKTDYRVSLNSMERHRSYYNHGMTLCEIIKDNKKYNGRDVFNGDSCDVSVTMDDPDITERGIPAEPAEPKKKKAATETKATKKVAKTKMPGTKTPKTNTKMPGTKTPKTKTTTAPKEKTTKTIELTTKQSKPTIQNTQLDMNNPIIPK